MRQLISCAILALLLVSGCAPPKSVIQLGMQTAESQAITAQQHLDTLTLYRESLIALKADIKALMTMVVQQQDSRSQIRGSLHKEIVNLRVNSILASFDNKAQEFLKRELTPALEKHFWPQIIAKYNALKAKEAVAHAKLEATPGDPVFQKQFREYSLNTENLLRLGYEKESQLRQEAFQMYIQKRGELKKLASSRLTPTKSSTDAKTDLTQKIDEVEVSIDEVIASIDQVKIEIQTTLESQAQAIKQINEYLIRPREWELFLKGVNAQIKTMVGSYTGILKDLSIPETEAEALTQVAGQAGSSLINSALNHLKEKVTKTLTDAGTKLINTANEKIEQK